MPSSKIPDSFGRQLEERDPDFDLTMRLRRDPTPPLSGRMDAVPISEGGGDRSAAPPQQEPKSEQNFMGGGRRMGWMEAELNSRVALLIVSRNRHGKRGGLGAIYGKMGKVHSI